MSILEVNVYTIDLTFRSAAINGLEHLSRFEKRNQPEIPPILVHQT